MPMIKIGAGGIVRELHAISQQHVGILIEAEQFKSTVVDEIFDLRKRESMLLDMEQEIAAIACGVEIGAPRDGSGRRCLVERKDVLPVASDVVDRRLISAHGGEI